MTVKILITYHDKHPLIKSDILMPIQTGCVNAPELFDGMLRDDDGDNISDRNDKFSELSAFYWAWKNYDKLGDPDYIGFMHYRRMFVFDERLGLPYPKWISSFYYIPSVTAALAYCQDNAVENGVREYDYLIPMYHVSPTTDIREEYIRNISGSHAEVFDTFIQVCREIRPDWEEEIQKIENGNVVSICNMFVMKKQLFFDYCEFAFPVLFELEKRIDSSGYTENGKRFLGYMAEKLQTMYTFRLEKNKALREKFLKCLYVRPDLRKSDVLSLSFCNPMLDFYKKHKTRLIVKKTVYRLLMHIFFGKQREKIRNKYQKLKEYDIAVRRSKKGKT